MGISLDEVVAGALTKFGDGSACRLTDQKFKKFAKYKTGIPVLDKITGIGGLPKGRIIEISGPESCLDGGTFIEYNTRTLDGKIINHKGGSLYRLYERFKGVILTADRRGKKEIWNSTNAIFTAPCVNEEKGIIHNRIIDVVDAGEKECFKIEVVEGYSIVATAEHRFLTEEGFKQLLELKVGDKIFIHNNTHFKSKIKKQRIYVPGVKGLRYHPYAKIRNINGYIYSKIGLHRAVVEADMNKITLEEYVKRLNSKDVEGMIFLSKEQNVHHKDGNRLNNNLSNLFVTSNSEHLRLHCKNERFKNNLNFVAVLGTISTINPVGVKRVFDIKMEEPFHNFVADKFVVHNSGKTTTVLTIIANAQKEKAWAWYGDMEHSLDPVWAENLGVNLDKMIVSQPDCAEQCLDMAQYMIETGVMDIVVIDSVASLVPKAELEGSAGDVYMGLQARLMSQAMRRMASKISRTECIAIFTNQIREKIGVRFGSPETNPGGRALKFYASIRIDVRRIGSVEQIKQEDSIGNVLKFTIKKNKCAPPFKIAEASLLFKDGFNFGYNILQVAVDVGVITKSGHSYSWKDKVLGKRMEAMRIINEFSEEDKTKLYDEVLGIEVKEKSKEEMIPGIPDDKSFVAEIPETLPKEEDKEDEV